MWISIKQASDLLGVTERAVRKSLENNKFTNRSVDGLGRGGFHYEILLESLPLEAQDRYYQKTIEADYNNLTAAYKGLQRDEANRKAELVNQYRLAHLSVDEFLEMYNKENPEHTVTKSQLFRYQRKLKNKGLEALIDNRGGFNRGQCSISADAWEYFYSLYMTQQKRSIKLCYDKTKQKYSDVPSVSVFERKVRQIPEYAVIASREGEHALRDSFPYMQRDKTDIKSNQIWFSDHHITDVFVKNKKGKAKRLWLTVFFDARSGKVISYVLREEYPNASTIKEALYRGIVAHGLPNEIYFDNGADYRSKSFSKDFPYSVVKQLGIGTIYATAYHGQAKTVERFFGTLENRFGKLWNTYAGKDTKNRPEQMQISNQKIAELAPSEAEFSAALENYMQEYNNTGHSGQGMFGKCPNEVYQDNLEVKKEVYDKEALRLLFGTTVERIVQRNGIQIFNNFYYDERLIPYFGKRVIVTYLSENIDKVSVFDMDRKAICVAKAQIMTPFRNTTEADYREAAKKKKAVRNFVESHAPAKQLDVHQLIANEQAAEVAYSNNPPASKVDYILPAAQKVSSELSALEKSKALEAKRKGGDLATSMLKYYENLKEKGS